MKDFKFQPYVCNRRHDLLMMSMNLKNIYVLNNEGTGYCCIISGIRKSEAINLMQNVDVTEKVRHYKNLLKLNIRNNF